MQEKEVDFFFLYYETPTFISQHQNRSPEFGIYFACYYVKEHLCVVYKLHLDAIFKFFFVLYFIHLFYLFSRVEVAVA